jgi:Tfp pilus assembly protein PilO
MAYNYRTELERYKRYYQSLEPIFKRPVTRAYTTVIFSFLAVSLFGWYAIRPTIQTILYLRREITDKIAINKKMEDKISALIEAQANYQQVEPLLPSFSQGFPVRPDAVPAVIQMRNLASISGVLISAVQLPSVPLINLKDKQNSFDITVSIQGPYSAIRSYIEGLLSMRRIVTIDNFSVVGAPSSPTASASASISQQVLQLALKLKTYYLGE